MDMLKGLKALSLIAIIFVLTACGTLQISIENTPPAATGPGGGNKAVTGEPTVQPTTLPMQEASPTIPASSTPVVTPSATPEDGHLKVGQPVRIVQIQMMDAKNGWGIGQVETDLDDHILFTADGGLTWHDRTPLAALQDAPANGLHALAYFASPMRAWVSYAQATPSNLNREMERIWSTTDGGHTWTPSTPLDFSNVPVEFYLPSDLGFVNTTFGWIMVHIGAGMSHDYFAIFTSHDGGQSWQRVLDPGAAPQLMSCQKSGLAFSSESTGWLVGDCPGLMPNLYIYRTNDGGHTWNPVSLLSAAGQQADFIQTAGDSCGIPHLAYVSSRTIKFELRCTNFQTNSSRAWLYASEDGGATWRAYPLVVPYGSFDFLNTQEGWLLGSNQRELNSGLEIFHTTDGGRNWSGVTPVGWEGEVDFIDAQTGWVAARNADMQALVQTTDGGRNWHELKPSIAAQENR